MKHDNFKHYFLECLQVLSIEQVVFLPLLKSRSFGEPGMGYDCVYGSACDSSRPFDFE